MAERAAESPAGRSGGWRLEKSSSAYLRSAHEQAIDWHPWGEEPFELARRLHRPVLLDIGAAWCHWCHVMDEGTYSDAEVASLIRQHFIAVKVDRDENPEVDRRYQRAVSALSGEGGWPLTGFLTSEGEVFLGGTFFPPQDGMGRPGFRRVLKEVARLYRDEPGKVEANAKIVREAIERSRPVHVPTGAASLGFVESVRTNLSTSYDPVNAGFGGEPKFPHPTAISFLLADGLLTGDPRSTARGRETLLRMADGGMYDQIGGGFHRYSVDEGWHIPHFEKMGVDNAALLSVYSEGARRFGDARLSETVQGTLAWVLEVLGDPRGGFGTSQDADNAPGDDGGYFTWSRPELKRLLEPEELRLVSRFFGVGSSGRMPHDPERNVLFRLLPLSEAADGLSYQGAEAADALARALSKLRSARAERPTPVIDRALYAGLNGSFLRALVAASPLVEGVPALAIARRTADRLIEEAYRPAEGFAHRLLPEGASGFGLLEDQVDAALGLIELAGATLNPRYVEVARSTLELAEREFRDETGLFRDVAPALYDGPKVGSIGHPSYPLDDNPHLSPNAGIALAYLRLSSLLGEELWREKARSLLAAMAARLGGAGLFAAGAALGSVLLEIPAARVVIDGSGPESDRLYHAAVRSWHPNLWVFRGTPPAPFSLPEELSVVTGSRGSARALVCFGTRCLAPVTQAESLAPILLSGGSSAPPT
ncbi:MAG: thioredoxin domain-containing protein [Thermoplasmata archaeon]|nr:thioredoxin domain-containing protein [Thermoplasmata archaeon]